ncbi:MAG: hypothetical protein JXM70_01870, partial [Pirellulales bacterium]|nr:hypothetical protein [Pirellulales bacterium]
MKISIALTCFLLTLPAAVNAADFDASLRQALTVAGMKNPLRLELQRPVDARLFKIETQGVEGSGLFKGTLHVVRCAAEVRSLSEKLKPGDQLVLAGDNWKDARFTFAGTGTEQAPILIRPEKPGDAVFTGTTEISFYGVHLIIMGIEFREVHPAKDNTVIFRLGSSEEKPAEHCIANRIKFDNCGSLSSEDWPRIRLWLMNVRGHANTVANCTFAGLKNIGQMLGAANLPAEGLQQLHVLNNRFTSRPKIDGQ